MLYSMYHHLGDFAVIGGLLKKFDLLEVEFESLVAHRNSPHVSSFDGLTTDRFFNVATFDGVLRLDREVAAAKRGGASDPGDSNGPGFTPGLLFLLDLKKLGALTYIVDFNLIMPTC